MKKNTVCFLTLIAFLASAHAAIIEFTEDFSGGPNWGFDSSHANGAGDTADIGGSGAFEIAATGYTTGDGVYLQKIADNSGAASETGSYRVNLQINPWEMVTSTWDVVDIFEVGRVAGNTSSFTSGGAALKLSFQKNPGAQQFKFIATTTRRFYRSTQLERWFSYSATDSDGFIDISLDLTLSADGDDWTYDLTFNSEYDGVTAGETGSTTVTDTGEVGLRDIGSYRIGLDITGSNTIGSGSTLSMDNFEVTVIPEPSSLLLLLGAVGAFFLFRRRL